MITADLLDYIKGERERGISDDALRQAMTTHGWADSDVGEAFTALERLHVVPPRPEPPKPIKPEAPNADESLRQIHTPLLEEPPVPSTILNEEHLTLWQRTKKISESVNGLAYVPRSSASAPTRPLVEHGWHEPLKILRDVPPLASLDSRKGVPGSIVVPRHPVLPQAPRGVPVSTAVTGVAESPPQQQVTLVLQGGKWKKVIGVILVILGLTLLGAGGAWGYFTFIGPDPAEIIKESLLSLKDLHSATYEIDVAFSSSNLFSTSTLLVSGSFDVTDKKKPAISTSFKTNIRIDQEPFVVSLAADIETRFINQVLYANLHNFSISTSTPIFPPEYLGLLEALKDKWVSLPQDILGDELGIRTDIESPDISEEGTENILGNEEHKFLRITDTSTTLIDGEKFHRFAFEVDKEELAAYLRESKQRHMGGSDTPFEGLDEDTFDNLLTLTGEIFIRKSDKMLGGVNITLLAENEVAGTIFLSLNTSLRDWNEPVSVAVPADALTTEDLSSIIGGYATTTWLEQDVPSSGSSIQMNTKMRTSSINTTVPSVVRERADEIVISSVGEDFFKQLYSFKSADCRGADQLCLNRPASCARYLTEPYCHIRYTLNIPGMPVDETAEFVVDREGNLISEYPPDGLLDCVASPTECLFPIDSNEASSIAKANGLKRGMGEWKTSLHWDVSHLTYVWTISNTLGGDFENGTAHGEEIIVDANDGRVIDSSKWFAPPDPVIDEF